MGQKYRRFPIKTKKAKKILEQASNKLSLNLEELVDSKAKIESAQTNSIQIILIDNKPVLFKTENDYLPTLTFKEALERLPKAVVDMGAVPHVCNGADIMAPGIVRFEGQFQEDATIVIAEIKHNKPLALGTTIYNSQEIQTIKKGAVIKNIHYVGDQIWDLTKNLIE